MLERWVQEASAELGIDAPGETKELLDVARVVAHTVERRAAPVTTYLMGTAVASGEVSDAVEAARRLIPSREPGGAQSQRFTSPYYICSG